MLNQSVEYLLVWAALIAQSERKSCSPVIHKVSHESNPAEDADQDVHEGVCVTLRGSIDSLKKELDYGAPLGGGEIRPLHLDRFVKLVPGKMDDQESQMLDARLVLKPSTDSLTRG